jgi:hypothetical protein
MAKIDDREKGPEHFAELARGAQQLGRYADAARLWRKAAGASAGHNRRASYEKSADHCDKLALGVRLSGDQLTKKFYAAVREADGREWIDQETFSGDREHAGILARSSDNLNPGWAKANPVKRIALLRVTEETD